MDLEECKRKGVIKKTFPNKALVKSLLEVSSIKAKVIKKTNLDEENLLVFLPAAYDALRGTLEAFCVLEGYKVVSHVCLGELVKALDPAFDFSSFDRFRYARNGVNYYGRRIGLGEGRNLIGKVLKMEKQIAEKTRNLL